MSCTSVTASTSSIYVGGQTDRPSQLRKAASLDLRARLHFYNVPVEEGGSASNALSMIRHVARRDDFVVVKVDMDGGPELPVMHAIANNPDLAALVDEIYFEYHFNVQDENLLVGQGRTRVHARDTVDDALRLMTTLRAQGVRSHFWI